MSDYILLETGDKIENEDESGFLLLDSAVHIHRRTKACKKLKESPAINLMLKRKAEYLT